MNQFGGKEVTGGIKTVNRLGVLALSGLAGGFIGFLLSEVLVDLEVDSELQLKVVTGIWFGLALFGIGAAIIVGNALLDRRVPPPESIAIAVGALGVGGFVAGFIAQTVFETMVSDEGSVRLARAIGWMIAGALGGLAVGASFRSVKRLQNGLIGGAGGGLIGGLLFDSFGTDVLARALGITLISTLMGVLIGLIDTARTNMWLEVLSGEMRGRQFLIMEARTTVGSSRSAGVCLLSDRAIAEVHLFIDLSGNAASFVCSGQNTVVQNGSIVNQGRAAHGDVLRIGNTDVRIGMKGAQTTFGNPNQPVTAPSQPQRMPANQHGASQPWQNAPAPQAPRPTPQSAPPAARPRLPTKPQ
jgi:hypothetical protein